VYVYVYVYVYVTDTCRLGESDHEHLASNGLDSLISHTWHWCQSNR